MAIILIVEDEFGIAKLLEEVLEDEGHCALLATNGRQAFEKAVETRPDLVITDFMMPIMDGAALIEALANHTELKEIPIILMSSMPEVTVAERCSGYVSFLRKPFRILEVIDLVEGQLAEKKSE
jgi:CheY-like chemotaxis protein